MKDSNCIFCKLANGEIPTNAIYEDESYKVILDNAPATKGHALILPKEHYADFFELPNEKAVEVIQIAKKLLPVLKETLKADGYNLVQNNGTCAGQTVRHFHLHMVPRYENDGQDLHWTPGNPSDEELTNVKEVLAKAIIK